MLKMEKEALMKSKLKFLYKAWQLNITKMSHTTPCFVFRFKTMSMENLLKTLFLDVEINLFQRT